MHFGKRRDFGIMPHPHHPLIQDPLACNIARPEVAQKESNERQESKAEVFNQSSPEAEVFKQSNPEAQVNTEQSCPALFEEVARRSGRVAPICPILQSSKSIKPNTSSIFLFSFLLLPNDRLFHVLF